MRLVMGGDVKHKTHPPVDCPSFAAGVRFQSLLAAPGQLPLADVVHVDLWNLGRLERDECMEAVQFTGRSLLGFCRMRTGNSFDVFARMFSTMSGNQPVIRTSLGHGMIWFFAAA